MRHRFCIPSEGSRRSRWPPRSWVVLEMEEWPDLVVRLVRHQMDFMIDPVIRFEVQPEEVAIMVRLEPSGNGLELESIGSKPAERQPVDQQDIQPRRSPERLGFSDKPPVAGPFRDVEWAQYSSRACGTRLYRLEVVGRA